MNQKELDDLLERMDVLCENTHGLLGQMEKKWKKVGSPGWAMRGFRAPSIGPTAPAIDPTANPPFPLNPGDNKGQQKIGEWTNEFECETGDPVIAVSVAVRVSDQNISDFLAFGANIDYSDAYLICSYGTSNRGPESILEVDLVYGTAWEIIGNRATFWLVYPKTSVPNGGQSPNLDLSIPLGLGASGGVGNVPRRTKKTPALIQNQESVRVAIPPFAHLAILQVTDTTTQAVLKQYGSGGGGVMASSLIGTTPNTAVPIANGARFFTLTNTAGGTTGPAVVFLLNPS